MIAIGLSMLINFYWLSKRVIVEIDSENFIHSEGGFWNYSFEGYL